MTHTHVTATHTQIIESLFPGHEIEVRFQCAAKITMDDEGDEVSIIFEPTTGVSIDGGAWMNIVTPTESTSDGRRFLGLMRDTARKAAAKLEKQIKPDPMPAPELREYKHTMEQMFPPFRPISPFSDEWFAG
jgi:hypothetical protein